MLNGKKIVVVLPAYQAGATLDATYRGLPHEIVDETILVDDASTDDTVQQAQRLGLKTIVHAKNRGYGANQKTCYAAALAAGADIVVMVHPDYQYEPALAMPMAAMVATGVYDVVLGSRILGGGALRGGMPLWRYVANRALTLVENLLLGAKLSEYHTGYRAYSREVLEALPLDENSDDFVFDNEFLVQCIVGGFRLGEVSCPTRYHSEASSINLRRSIIYGCGVLRVTLQGALCRLGLSRSPLFRGIRKRAEGAAKS
jgi:glycosyltransferase involved in cell wall biosynthesis